MSKGPKKGQRAKISVPCPNIIKSYNANMGVVDILEQKTAAYRLDRTSAGGRYYLRLCFDLMDMARVNAHVVSILRDPKGVELLNFKQVVAKGLIGIYNTRSRNPASIKQSKRSFQPTPVPILLPVVGTHAGSVNTARMKGRKTRAISNVVHVGSFCA